MLIKLVIFSILLFSSSPSMAGNIRLDADEQVEYHQKEQKLVAKGNAVASKDNLSISADTLIGYYAPKNKSKISKVEAIGNVKMVSPEASAIGNNLVYQTTSQTATLTGNPATIKTNDTTISSKGPIIYYQQDQKAVATDNVIATDAKGNKVFADKMVAYFDKTANGKLNLNKIDIDQNIKIVSSDATITALKGTYNATTGKITLSENVIINQNGNILKGSEAETNLNTGISKILSSGSNGRVSGIFKEKKKKE